MATRARRKLPGLDAVESAEGKLAAKVSASLGPPWRAQVALVKSHATVKLAQLPWKVSVHEARLALTPEHVRVEGLRGGVGESSFSHAALQLDLRTPMRVSAASGRATLKLEQWLPWLHAQFPLEEVTALSGLLDVTLDRLALRLDRPAEAGITLALVVRHRDHVVADRHPGRDGHPGRRPALQQGQAGQHHADLLASGGHSQIVYVRDWGEYETLGHTNDDAAGEGESRQPAHCASWAGACKRHARGRGRGCGRVDRAGHADAPVV